MDKKEITAFFDRLAPSWDEGQIIDEEKINRILDAAGIETGITVLDAACGTGVLFPFYLQRNCRQIVGVDISSAMCEIAQNKFADEHITVINSDLEALSQKDSASYAEYFDCCVIYNAFPHFPHPQELIKEIFFLLKSGGRLTIAHSMGKAQINAHHSGSAAAVSRGLEDADKTARFMEPYFELHSVIDEEDIYIVAGRKK